MPPNFFERLFDISLELANNRALDPLLKYAMSIALDLLDAENGYLVLLREDGELDFRVRQDKQGRELEQPEEKISHTIFDKVIEKREPLITLDAIEDPRFHEAASVLSLQLRSVMCAPLISRGEILGAIYLENWTREESFNAEHLRALTFFAAQTAVAIENALLNEDLEGRIAKRTRELEKAMVRLEERTKELEAANIQLSEEIQNRKEVEAELYKLSITDPLTEVHNRRHFFVRSKDELDRAKRYKISLSIVMIDLDDFKKINDRYGHATGDQVLRMVARLIEKSIRSIDILGRYGGEEFSILLPETPEIEAIHMAERLRDIFANNPFETEKGPVGLTISLGLASRNGDQELTLDQLIDRADQALYFSKDRGRNHVSTWAEIVKAKK